MARDDEHGEQDDGELERREKSEELVSLPGRLA